MFYYVPAVVKVQMFVHNVIIYHQVHNCYNVVMSLSVGKYQQCNISG